MNLLATINNLFSGNRGLEQCIEENLLKNPKTADEIQAYLQLLGKALRSATEHKDMGQYLLVGILRELRAMEFQVNQIQTGQCFPVLALSFDTELTAIQNTRELLISRFHEIDELVGRMEKRIALLQQTIEIHGKQSVVLSQEYS